MDEITVTAKIRKDESDSKPCLCVDVEIGEFLLANYEQNDLAVDLTELAKSLDGDGEYFIITCVCGDAGCAGINEGIHVSQEQISVRWLIRNRGKGPEPERIFTFKTEEYRRAIKHGLLQFMQLYENNPNIEITPNVLRDRIEFAKKQNWLSKWLAA